MAAPDSARRTSSAKPIVSAVLDDGTIIESVYRAQTYETLLVAYRNGQITEQGQLDVPHRGRVVPYSPTNSLLSHGVVLLPSEAAEFNSVEALVAEIRAFIHRYADLSESFEEVATYYVLLTWIYDAFTALPYLRLKGDFGSGKSRCLQTIGSLCYKPIFASGASTVSPLFRILDAFGGTLVIDESDFRFSDERSEIVKILNNGSAAGFPVLRSEATPQKEYNPTAFSVFGPKIIATRRSFDDGALESRCITEVMSGLPPRADIPISLPADFAAKATALRNQLLMYRFRHYAITRGLNTDRDPRMEARIAQVFAPLLAVVEDEEVRDRLVALARGKSSMLLAERSATLEAQLLDIMGSMRRDSVPLVVKDIADRFAERYGLDYQRPITPRWIGAQLRNRLSLTPVKTRGNFVLPHSDNARLEVLFRRFGFEDVAVDVGTLGTSEDMHVGLDT